MDTLINLINSRNPIKVWVNGIPGEAIYDQVPTNLHGGYILRLSWGHNDVSISKKVSRNTLQDILVQHKVVEIRR